MSSTSTPSRRTPGESAFELAGKYPGSTTGDSVRPVPRSDGTTDLVIAPELFRDNFCADLPEEQAARMAATQRPATLEALQEPSGERSAWKRVPSWFLIGEEDHNLPAALHRFLAERAGARRTVEIPGASHAISVSQPRRRRSRSSRPRRCTPAHSPLSDPTTARTGVTMSATNTQSPVVLEQASQEFVDAAANPPFLYELTPAGARKVLDDVQAAPIDKLDVEDRWITVPAEVGDVRVRIVRPPDAAGRCR